jgi:hypothetical protein
VVTLDPKAFTSPNLRTQLDALLSITDALRAHLSGFVSALDDEEAPDWQAAVDALARLFGQRVGTMTSLDKVDSLWKQFLLEPAVEGLPPSAQDVLAQVRTALDAHLLAPKRIVDVLDRANVQAHQTVRMFLTRLELQTLLPPQPVDVRVYADPDGKRACASTARGLGYVTWSFQPLPRAVWGGLALQHVLEHEYLSHLTPRSENLSPLAREVWLVHALTRDHRNSAQDPKRYELEASLSGRFHDLLIAGAGAIGGRAVLAGAGLLQRLPAHYDALTVDLLRLPVSEAEAWRVDQLLRSLASLKDAELTRFGSSPWPGLAAFSLLVLRPSP